MKQFQYDPVVKVANNGVVYATWMNKYDIVFSKSTDHGATWTAPIEVSGSQWGDKPWIGVSPERGATSTSPTPRASDVWIAASHNSGASFAPAVKLNNDNGRYRYPNGLEVLRERHRRAVGLELPGRLAAGERRDRHRDVAHHERRHVVDAHRDRQGVHRASNSRPPRRRRSASDTAGTLVALYTGATSARRQRPGLDAPIDRRRRDVGAGGPARERRRPTRASRRSRAGRAGSSASTTATTAPAHGTRGTARRPTAARRGAPRSTSPTPTRARRTRPRPDSRRSTATTARSTSRTRARPSRSGARARASRPGPEGSGSTDRSDGAPVSCALGGSPLRRAGDRRTGRARTRGVRRR